MHSGDDIEAFERELRQDRLRIADQLRRAANMLPGAATIRSTIDEYARMIDRNDLQVASTQLTLAIDLLESHARGNATRQFWLILQDIAVRETLYERAMRYRDRAASG